MFSIKKCNKEDFLERLWVRFGDEILSILEESSVGTTWGVFASFLYDSEIDENSLVIPSPDPAERIEDLIDFRRSLDRCDSNLEKGRIVFAVVDSMGYSSDDYVKELCLDVDERTVRMWISELRNE